MTPSQCQAIWTCSNSISVVSWVANIFSGLLALRITNIMVFIFAKETNMKFQAMIQYTLRY